MLSTIMFNCNFIVFDIPLFPIERQIFVLQFTVMETKRQKGEKLKLQSRHETQLKEFEAKSLANLKELTQLQREKKKLLEEHESDKLKKMEEKFAEEMRLWKNQLPPRKKVKIISAFIACNVVFPTCVIVWLKTCTVFMTSG